MGSAASATEDLVWTLDYSRDRGEVYLNPRDRTALATGKRNQRLRWWRCGESYDQVWRLHTESKAKISLTSAWFDASGASSLIYSPCSVPLRTPLFDAQGRIAKPWVDYLAAMARKAGRSVTWMGVYDATQQYAVGDVVREGSDELGKGGSLWMALPGAADQWQDGAAGHGRHGLGVGL